jgi:hypothetical protein
MSEEQHYSVWNIKDKRWTNAWYPIAGQYGTGQKQDINNPMKLSLADATKWMMTIYGGEYKVRAITDVCMHDCCKGK